MLEYMGASIIKGSNWCEKTIAAKQFHMSFIELQDSEESLINDDVQFIDGIERDKLKMEVSSLCCFLSKKI